MSPDNMAKAVGFKHDDAGEQTTLQGNWATSHAQSPASPMGAIVNNEPLSYFWLAVS
jgi:hypothetical protein